MDSPTKSQNDNIQTRNPNNVQLSNSLVVWSAQGVPRASRMDPVDSREQPIVHRRVECVDSIYTTILEILTNNSKVLATAVRRICRGFSEAPIEYFGMGIIERASGRHQIDKEVWKRLSKTKFFALTEADTPGYDIVAMPYEVKKPGLKILCPSGILDDRDDLQVTFSNIREVFQLIREHQNNLLLALKNDFLRILEIQVNGSGDVCALQNSKSELLKKKTVNLVNIFFQRCGFLETSLSKMTPTSLNSYLVYEMILVEYFTVSHLFVWQFLGEEKFYCEEFVKTVAIELSYIFHILEALKPFAFNAYEDLGYDKEDFNASDAEIRGIYEKLIEMLVLNKRTGEALVSTILPMRPEPSVSSSRKKRGKRGKGGKGNSQPDKKIQSRIAEQKAPEPKDKVAEEPKVVQKAPLPLKPLPIELTAEQLEAKKQDDLKQKLLDENRKKQEDLRLQWEAERAKEAVARPKKPEQPDWNEIKKRQEMERIERKAAEARGIVSDFNESVEAAEQKKLAERIASTKVFYTLPSRKQFKLIYEALNNDHKCTYDALFTAESFSITSDKIHQLAEKIAILMIEMGLDPVTAKAFVTEVLNRNHPAHKSTDTGKELPEGFIKKRSTSFIIFGLYPIDWQPSSADEYKALKKCQQRRIDRKLSELNTNSK